MIKISMIMEVKKHIDIMIKFAKEESNCKRGYIMMIAKHSEFNL